MALIRFDDFYRIREKLKQGYLSRAVDSIIPFGNRTKRAWNHTAHPPKHWGSIPRIRQHWNECISGFQGVGLQEYVAANYPHLKNGAALSIGCGSGSNELLWAQTGLFGTVQAFDLSPSRIEVANRAYQEGSFPTNVNFSVASFAQIPEFGSGFRAVLAENALHHSRDLQNTIESLCRCLRPGGLLILRDFVGPSRFQWTDEQLSLTKTLLAEIPKELRTRWKSNSPKERHFTPGTLSMMLSDPSEAAQSSNILPLLKRKFDQVELKPLGGTLLQLVFDDIAHHFIGDSEKALDIVERCIRTESRLIQKGQLKSDFVFGIFRRPE